MSFPETRQNAPGSSQPVQVNYITLSPRPGVDSLSVSPVAPGRGVNITRKRGLSLDASTRSSSSGTSMSISSNSKLKAALTWPGQTRPAVALFSRPTRLSSSRSARVILIRRWQSAMADLTGTLLGISPILQRQLKEGAGMRAGCSASTFILVAEWDQSLHLGSPGHRLANREGPVNAENALRTTGLLTAGRNPRGTERALLPAFDDRRQTGCFRRVVTPVH